MKLNTKSVAGTKNLRGYLAVLLLTAVTNINCIYHEKNTLDFSKTSVNQFIPQVNKVKDEFKEFKFKEFKFKSADEYKKIMNSLNHVGIDFKKIDELIKQSRQNKSIILELSKKHSVDLEKLQKKNILDVLEQDKYTLTLNEISFLNDFRKTIALSDTQIEKIKDLKGKVRRYDHLFSSNNENENKTDNIGSMLWLGFFFFMATTVGIKLHETFSQNGSERDYYYVFAPSVGGLMTAAMFLLKYFTDLP